MYRCGGYDQSALELLGLTPLREPRKTWHPCYRTAAVNSRMHTHSFLNSNGTRAVSDAVPLEIEHAHHGEQDVRSRVPGVAHVFAAFVLTGRAADQQVSDIDMAMLVRVA